MQLQFETKNYTFLERVQNVWNNPSELIEKDNSPKNIEEFLEQKCGTIFQNNRQTTLKEMSEKERALIIGLVQSGKTSVLHTLAIYMSIIKKEHVILLVSNDLQLAMQLKDDLKRITDKIRTDFKKSIISCEVQLENNEGLRSRFNDNQENDPHKKGSITILMANSERVERLVNLLEHEEHFLDIKFSILVDEVHLNIKDIGTKLNVQFEIIKEKYCRRLFGVTATGLSILFKDQTIKTNDCFQLHPPSDYKGANLFEWDIIDGDQEDIVNTSNLDLYRKLSSTTEKILLDKNGNLHPLFIMHKEDRKKAKHESLIDDIYTVTSNYQKEWVIMCINSDGIRVRCTKSRVLDLQKSNVRISPHEYLDYTDYIFKTKDYRLNQVISIIRKSLEKECNLENVDPIDWKKKSQALANICIIGGDMLSIGISVVCCDYTWHLTNLYYDAKKTDSCNAIQALRICGRYKDNIQLTVHTREYLKTEILNAMNFQIKILQRSSVAEPDTDIQLLITEIKLNKDECLDMKIASNCKKLKISSVENDMSGIFCGYTNEQATLFLQGKSFRFITEKRTVPTDQYFKDNFTGAKFQSLHKNLYSNKIKDFLENEDVKLLNLNSKYRGIYDNTNSTKTYQSNPTTIDRDSHCFCSCIFNASTQLEIIYKTIHPDDIGDDELFVWHTFTGLYYATKNEILDEKFIMKM